MTSFANKMQIFLWQIATVIPIKGTRTYARLPNKVVDHNDCLEQTIVGALVQLRFLLNVGFNTWLRYSQVPQT